MSRYMIASVAVQLFVLAGASWAETGAPKTVQPLPDVQRVEGVTASLSLPDPVPPPDPIAEIGQPDVAECRQLGKVFFDLSPQKQSDTADQLISCVRVVTNTE